MQGTLFDDALASAIAPPAPARHDYRAKASQAASHADRRSPGWTADAARLFVDYALLKANGKPFLTEDAVAYAHASGLTDPPDRRAWGGVVGTLKAKRRIAACGFALDKTGAPKTQWVLTGA